MPAPACQATISYRTRMSSRIIGSPSKIVLLRIRNIHDVLLSITKHYLDRPVFLFKRLSTKDEEEPFSRDAMRRQL